MNFTKNYHDVLKERCSKGTFSRGWLRANKTPNTIRMLSFGLLIIFLIVKIHPPALVEAQGLGDFSIEKLMEYNELVACISVINQDFTACNTKGAEKAKSVLGKMDMGEELGKRIRCCGAWKLRDCWVRAAAVKCKKEQAEQIYKLPSLFMPGLETECRDYMPESGKCEFPTFLAVSIVAALGFVLATCIGSIYMCIRCQRRRRRYLDGAKGHHVSGHKAHYRAGHHDMILPGKKGVLVMNGEAHHLPPPHHHHHQHSGKTLMTVDGTVDGAGEETTKMLNGNANGVFKSNKPHRHHHQRHEHTQEAPQSHGNGKAKANGVAKIQSQPLPPPPDIRVEMPSIHENQMEENKAMLL